MSDTSAVCPHCGYAPSFSEKEAAVYAARSNPDTADFVADDEGNGFAGFALGFLLGLIGLIIALCIGKRAVTKGALFGWAVQVGAAVTIWAVVACSAFGYFR